MKSRYGKLNGALGLGVIAFVVVLLVFIGMAGALNLGLYEFKTTSYTVGETIDFLAGINITSNEGVSIQEISLEVNQEIVCVFAVSGEELKGCDGIEISVVPNSANFIYGNEVSGHLVYNISIDTLQPYVNAPSHNNFRLITQTLTQTLNSSFYPILIGDSASLNFSMGTYDGEAIFSGIFDNSTLTFIGEVRWLGDPNMIRVGAGNYLPTSSTSGSLFVHFINPQECLLLLVE
ncbi:hypothetical protein J4423_04680 [Candidatus Pacearchaeota archaeon]|nr:hypothetical protein [Candidatus Pacearchaeota archaeon]